VGGSEIVTDLQILDCKSHQNASGARTRWRSYGTTPDPLAGREGRERGKKWWGIWKEGKGVERLKKGKRIKKIGEGKTEGVGEGK